MATESEVTTIARVIQLAVAPVFLLAVVTGLLGVLTNRLARIIDRARVIEGQIETTASHLKDHGQERLLLFSKRARLVNFSITLCTGCASIVCLMIISLFADVFLSINLSKLIAILFMTAMVSLFAALVCFLREIRIATKGLRIGVTAQN